MTRARVATVLGVVALMCVVGTAAVAMTRPADDEAATLSVSRGGASFEVPAEGWQVEDRDVRIYYTDDRGRPLAVVRGPAVYDAGYCGTGSNRAFAGFTRQGLDAWVRALGAPGRVDRETVDSGLLTRVEVDVRARGACSAPEVEVAMIETGDVRVVLVQDAGTLAAQDVERVLTSLELP